MRACVVLPTYNEAGTIGEVVARARAAGADVLVVDDASPDGTGALADRLAGADAGIAVLHRAGKGGLGPAYLAGFARALADGYDLIAEMDADLSHDPADLARLFEAAREADLVIGSRYVAGGGTRNWSKVREAISRGGNRYARLVLGFALTDATSGFRVYRRALLETLPLDEIRSEGYGFQVEMAWRAWALGFRVVEIPIVFSERREGSSKMSRGIVLEAAARVLRWGLRGPRRAAAPHARSVSSTG